LSAAGKGVLRAAGAAAALRHRAALSDIFTAIFITISSCIQWFILS
jgi:hypothetical protein